MEWMHVFVQRSVTSALQCHAIRRVPSAASMARPPSHVCASLDGGACAVRMVGRFLENNVHNSYVH